MSHTPAESCTECQKPGRSDYPLLRDAADRPWHRHCYLLATCAHVAARGQPHCRGCGSIHPIADLTHDALGVPWHPVCFEHVLQRFWTPASKAATELEALRRRGGRGPHRLPAAQRHAATARSCRSRRYGAGASVCCCCHCVNSAAPAPVDSSAVSRFASPFRSRRSSSLTLMPSFCAFSRTCWANSCE